MGLAVPWSDGWAAVGCDVHAKVVVWCGVAGSVARVGALQSAVLCEQYVRTCVLAWVGQLCLASFPVPTFIPTFVWR